MQRMRLLIYSVFLIYVLHGCSNKLIKLTVNSGAHNRIDCPVSIDTLELSNVIDLEQLQLVEIIDGSQKHVPSQLDHSAGKLCFILNGFTSKHTQRHFMLVEKSETAKLDQIQIVKQEGGLKLMFKEKPVLNYQYEMTYPPEGVDKKFGKSGFLHPVYSPEGEVLTRIHAPDHYHHYGIWGPWTRTRIGKRVVDFWNLGDQQGTVLFKNFLNETQGDVFSSFKALQEHIDFGAEEKHRVAINEALEVKAWNLGAENRTWLIDYTTKIETPLESGLLFEAYRYGGGIGFRATEKWHKDNSSVLTSKKKDRLTADGTSAKWAIIEGASSNESGRSGILFLGYPDNRAFPEPMRVWPVDANGDRGDVFFEFCPIRYESWEIEHNKAYRLNYRLVIFDGTLTAEEAEIHWQGFAHPPKIIISKN